MFNLKIFFLFFLLLVMGCTKNPTDEPNTELGCLSTNFSPSILLDYSDTYIPEEDLSWKIYENGQQIAEGKTTSGGKSFVSRKPEVRMFYQYQIAIGYPSSAGMDTGTYNLKVSYDPQSVEILNKDFYMDFEACEKMETNFGDYHIVTIPGREVTENPVLEVNAIFPDGGVRVDIINGTAKHYREVVGGTRETVLNEYLTAILKYQQMPTVPNPSSDPNEPTSNNLLTKRWIEGEDGTPISKVYEERGLCTLPSMSIADWDNSCWARYGREAGYEFLTFFNDLDENLNDTPVYILYEHGDIN